MWFDKQMDITEEEEKTFKQRVRSLNEKTEKEKQAEKEKREKERAKYLADTKAKQEARGKKSDEASLETKRLARSFQEKGSAVTDKEPVKVDGKQIKERKDSGKMPRWVPRSGKKVVDVPVSASTGKELSVERDDYISRNFAADEETVEDAGRYADALSKARGYELNGKDWERLHKAYLKASDDIKTLAELRKSFKAEIQQ